MNQQIYSQATLMIRLSSTAPPENHGFVARHDSSAPSFSAVTRSVSMLDVRFASCQERKKNVWRKSTSGSPANLTLLSLCTVMSALRSGSPSSSQTILAAGKEPHDSHLIGMGRPAVSSSFGVTILARSGFTGMRGLKYIFIIIISGILTFKTILFQIPSVSQWVSLSYWIETN